MKKITTTITQFPTAPNSTSDTDAEFNSKADAFVAHQATSYTPEVNAWATEANALATEINNIVGTIPTGTINDNTVATDKVWSSKKVEGELGKKASVEHGTWHIGTWTKYSDGSVVLIGGKGATMTNVKLLDVIEPLPFALVGLAVVNAFTIKETQEPMLVKGYIQGTDIRVSGYTVSGNVVSQTAQIRMAINGRWK